MPRVATHESVCSLKEQLLLLFFLPL